MIMRGTFRFLVLAVLLSCCTAFDADTVIPEILVEQTKLSDSRMKVVLDWIVAQADKTNAEFCYRETCTVLQCEEGEEKDGALCYTPCRDGYNGVGPVCWERCKEGYRDLGAICSKKKFPWTPKGKKSYGRGAGEPLRACGGKQKVGALCCNKCPFNLHSCGPGICAQAGKCGGVIANMVLAPVSMAVSIVSLGAASGAAGAVRMASKLTKIQGIISKMKKAYEAADRAAAGGMLASDLHELQQATSDFYEDTNTLGDLTHPEIDTALQRVYPQGSANYGQIKEAYARKMVQTMIEEAGLMMIKAAVEMADPTGVIGVVNAFMGRQCKRTIDPLP